MCDGKNIGIIGGTGTMGTLIVEYLARLLDGYTILVGGRRAVEETSFNRDCGYKLKYCQMDYQKDTDLDDFCARCLILINAAGPSLKTGDTIALCALKNNCHYIDIGGYDILYDLLVPHEKAIHGQKRCFVIGAGWMPGISGVFSRFIIESHLTNPGNTKFRIYYGAVDDWSYSSAYDLAVYSMGESRSYIYSYGKRKAVSSLRHAHGRFFPFIGYKKICLPSFSGELTKLALSLKQIKEVSSFVMVNDYTSMVKFIFLKAFYKNKPDKAALMLQNDYKRLVEKENKWGSVICQVSESNKVRSGDVFHYLYVNNNLLYTALPAVITVQHILNSKVKNGLNCLCDSLDCQSFMEDLFSHGIKYSCYERTK